MRMTVEKKTQLEELLTACEGLGADLRYHPEQGHFTALVWEGWDPPYDEERARTVQKKIQEMSAQYPNLVCYCFDPFSTLVYMV